MLHAFFISARILDNRNMEYASLSAASSRPCLPHLERCVQCSEIFQQLSPECTAVRCTSETRQQFFRITAIINIRVNSNPSDWKCSMLTMSNQPDSPDVQHQQKALTVPGSLASIRQSYHTLDPFTSSRLQ